MKATLVYKPEGGSVRRWTFDPENPAWDLAYVAEKETDWPWAKFGARLEEGSYIALRALVYAFRKRDEPRLTIEAVQVTLGELDFEVEDEPAAEPAAEVADPEA